MLRVCDEMVVAVVGDGGGVFVWCVSSIEEAGLLCVRAYKVALLGRGGGVCVCDYVCNEFIVSFTHCACFVGPGWFAHAREGRGR